MPPKKAAATGDAATGKPGKMVWEGPNDFKLLLLMQGRYVKPDEYAKLSEAIPGTTTGSIRNRISGLRVQQRDLYESLGWDVPDGGAGHSAKKPGSAKPGPKRKNGADSLPVTPTPAKKRAGLFAGKKRAASEEDEEIEEEGGSVQGTPTPKGKKVKVEKEDDDDEC